MKASRSKNQYPPRAQCPECGNEKTLDSGSGFVPAHPKAHPAGTTCPSFNVPAMPFGTKFLARFEIELELQSGAFARVFRAMDRRLKREVVVKTPKDQQHRSDFEREARKVAALQSPYVVTILDVFGDSSNSGSEFFIYELLRNGALDESLKKAKSKGLGIDTAMRTTWDILKGLSKLHGNNIVHRDIKPDNIFVGDDEIAKIGDLGLACMGREDLCTLESSDSVGSAEFRSPEQSEPNEQVDRRTDIYSVAQVLYSMLTGHLPPKSGSIEGAAKRAEQVRSALEKARDPETHAYPSPPLIALVLEAMEWHKEDRVSSAPEFLRRLERVPEFEMLRHGITDEGAEATGAARLSWVKKPQLRKVEYHANDSMPPVTESEEIRREFSTNKLADLDVLAEKYRVIVILGAEGTGKSWLAKRWLQSLPKEPENTFVWHSKFIDDWMTAVDSALAFFDRNPSSETEIDAPRLDRFTQALERESGTKILFDGIENFLAETNRFGVGKHVSWGVKNLLALIKRLERKSARQSTILLTSRSWPEEFGECDPRTAKVGIVHTWPMDLREIAGCGALQNFKDTFSPAERSKLFSLLNGQPYAIRLLNWIVGYARSRPETVKNVMKRLELAPVSANTSLIVDCAIQCIGATHGEERAVRTFLGRTSAFMNPVSRIVLETCKFVTTDRTKWREIEADLTASQLLYTVGDSDSGTGGVCLHPVVRAPVFDEHYAKQDFRVPTEDPHPGGGPVAIVREDKRDIRSHVPRGSNIANVKPRGFTAGKTYLAPGSREAGQRLRRRIEKLLVAGRQATERDTPRARELLRAAFGIARARMESNTCVTWTRLPDYAHLMEGILQLAQDVSERTWEYSALSDHETREGPDGPLYADEVSYLYNEIALTYYSIGDAKKSHEIWEQGFVINRLIDADERSGDGAEFSFTSLCTLASTSLLKGQLDGAEQYFRRASVIGARLDDRDHVGRIRGWLALVLHLRNRLEEADREYELALDEIGAPGSNRRATSIFLGYRADLAIQRGDLSQGERFLMEARAIARTAPVYPDLVSNLLLTEANLLLKHGRIPLALTILRRALSDAGEMGMERLAIEAQLKIARAEMVTGQFLEAAVRAQRALVEAERLGLGLARTRSMVVLGKAWVQMEHSRIAGIEKLKEARKLARQQGYWIRGDEAEVELTRLGVFLESL